MNISKVLLILKLTVLEQFDKSSAIEEARLSNIDNEVIKRTNCIGSVLVCSMIIIALTNYRTFFGSFFIFWYNYFSSLTNKYKNYNYTWLCDANLDV